LTGCDSQRRCARRRRWVGVGLCCGTRLLYGRSHSRAMLTDGSLAQGCVGVHDFGAKRARTSPDLFAGLESTRQDRHLWSDAGRRGGDGLERGRRRDGALEACRCRGCRKVAMCCTQSKGLECAERVAAETSSRRSKRTLLGDGMRMEEARARGCSSRT
jgi:hypothetical protein